MNRRQLIKIGSAALLGATHKAAGTNGTLDLEAVQRAPSRITPDTSNVSLTRDWDGQFCRSR
jgi:hypothetical protein